MAGSGGIVGLDHVAITVQDPDVSIHWYTHVLGAELLYADLWRAGRLPVALIRIGGSMVSIHPAAAPAAPHAERPTPGSADLCFRYAGPVDEIVGLLERCDVEIVDGPVARPAATGQMGTSVYFRDPDGNLLELLTTVEPEPA